MGPLPAMAPQAPLLQLQLAPFLSQKGDIKPYSSGMHGTDQPSIGLQHSHAQPSQSRSHGQPSQSQVHGQEQSHAALAPSGMLNGRDQYELLRRQPSFIPRQSQVSVAQVSPAQVQAAALQRLPDNQPHNVHSGSLKSSFSASAVSYQTPQAVSHFQSASLQESVTVQQVSGQVLTHSRSQHRQHSMHQQLDHGELSQASGASHAPGSQDHDVRAGHGQPYNSQASSRVEEVQSHSREGQGLRPSQQQQPYSVSAMQQKHMSEHTVSRSADGSSVTESRSVMRSSSHSEFSFRNGSSHSVAPPPGTLSCQSILLTIPV